MSFSIDGLMIELNQEYHTFLEAIKDRILKENSSPKTIIDSVSTFWNIRRKKANHIINFYSNDDCSTLNFTGVTIMDVESGEAIPFLMAGKRFVFDENISTRIKMLAMKNLDKKKLMDEILSEIDDELKIIEKYYNKICVLPVRFYYGNIKNVDFRRTVDEYFLYLFDGKFKSISEYLEQINSIEDIQKNINMEKFKKVSLSSYENVDITIKEKIDNFYEDVSFCKLNTNYGKKLHFACIAVLSQALDILYSNFACGFTPYLRNQAFLINLINVSGLYPNDESFKMINNIVINSVFSFSLYKNCKFELLLKKYKDLIPTDIVSKYYDYYNSYIINNKVTIDNLSLVETEKVACEFLSKYHLI